MWKTPNTFQTFYKKSGLINQDSLIAAVINVFSINRGQYPFKRKIGPEWDDLLFKNINFENALVIYNAILSSFNSFGDDRLQINAGKTYVEADIDNKSYKIRLSFYAKDLGNKEIEFNLNREILDAMILGD